MKAKLWLFFAILLFSLSFAALVSAQTGQVYFKEDFNYASLDQMQAAGWTFTRPAGISVGSGAVVLNGVAGDCTINYNNHFPTGIFNWKVESKSMWLGQGHSTNGVYVSTQKHSYSFSADGYYDEFAFYRDNVKILRFGSYQETANQYFVMTMVRQANTFSLYFNGELKNTYTEKDTQQSAATGIALCSPWRGDAKYDYYQLGEPTAVFTSSNPTVSTDSFPMVPVLVGGGIAAVVVGGIVVYYFFIAGGSSASAGGSGSVIQEHPISPLSGEAPLSPLSGEVPQSHPSGNLNSPQSTIDELRPPSLPDLQSESPLDALRPQSSFPNLFSGSQPQTSAAQTQSSGTQIGQASNEHAQIVQALQNNANSPPIQTGQASVTQNAGSTIDDLRPPNSLPNLQTGQLEPGSSSPQPIPQNIQTNTTPPTGTIDDLRPPGNLPDTSKKIPKNSQTSQ